MLCMPFLSALELFAAKFSRSEFVSPPRIRSSLACGEWDERRCLRCPCGPSDEVRAKARLHALRFLATFRVRMYALRD